MRRASIDIGSNSVLLLVGEVDGENFQLIDSQSRIVGLGRGLETGSFRRDSMDLCRKVFLEYKDIVLSNGINVEDVLVTATEASRVANNARSFFTQIEKEMGFQTKTINPEGEAYYSLRGIEMGLSSDQIHEVVMDLGGASTEVSKINWSNSNISHSTSLPIGCVRAKDWLDSGELEEKVSNILESNKEILNELITQVQRRII